MEYSGGKNIFEITNFEAKNWQNMTVKFFTAKKRERKKMRVALQEREEATFLKHLTIFYFIEQYFIKYNNM